MSRQAGAARGGRRFGDRDLTAAVLVTTVSALPSFLTATMAVQIRQSLPLGAASSGLAISLLYIGAAASSVPFSRLVEAIGGGRARSGGRRRPGGRARGGRTPAGARSLRTRGRRRLPAPLPGAAPW